MNYIHEAFKKLNTIGKLKKEAWTPYADGVSDWIELSTFEDVYDFGQGCKWIVSGGYGGGMTKEQAKLFYDAYIEAYPGMVFVGREDSSGKMLGMKLKDGSITNVYDANNKEVKAFDMKLGKNKQ